MDLDSCVDGWEIFGGIGVVKAGPGGGEPGRIDGKAGSGVEVADEGASDGEVMGVEGGRGHRVSGNDVWWTGIGMIFEAERETP